MFTFRCDCKNEIQLATTRLDLPFSCAKCGREIVCVSVEPLDDVAAAGDFDAALMVVAAPVREGQVIALGGCAAITLGSDAGNRIVLPGEGVAANHARLVRVDFGPSKWRIENVGGAPLVVNEQEIAAAELGHGDSIQLGEFELRYQLVAAAEGPIAVDDAAEAPRSVPLAAQPAPVRPARVVRIQPPERKPPASEKGKASSRRADTDNPTCPSCGRRLIHGAKICVDCGIRVPSGRPLLTSQSLDENMIYGNAEAAVRVASWFLPFSPVPIPLASEAYGKFKPYATWAIAAITFAMSLWMLSACWSDEAASAKGLMLWPLHPNYAEVVEREMKQLEKENKLGATVQNLANDPGYTVEKHRARVDAAARRFSFHVWQLLTYAVVHDPGSLFWFILQLGGNMLFLFVFGARVNAIIGNTATAIIYPLLAIASGLAFLLALPDDRMAALSGASGAVHGLAGIYLVLLPAHYVYCGVWGRFGRSFAMKVFALRGFWLLLIYIAFDLLVTLGSQDQAVQIAHMSGFLCGIVAGLSLLMSRKFDCRNGDLLSVVLGKHAWPLVGKPNRPATEVVEA